MCFEEKSSAEPASLQFLLTKEARHQALLQDRLGAAVPVLELEERR